MGLCFLEGLGVLGGLGILGGLGFLGEGSWGEGLVGGDGAGEEVVEGPAEEVGLVVARQEGPGGVAGEVGGAHG